MRFNRAKQLISECSIPGGIPLADMSTALTKGIRFSANAVSRTMDTASGGYLKHGGLHRLYGGHDISNFTYWQKFGLKFPKEIGKDMLTSNGVPYPKLELLVKKGWVKASTAQKYGTWNIGKVGATGIGALDSAFNVRRFVRSRDEFEQRWVSTSIKGAVKISTGITSGNLPLVAVGTLDLSLVAISKLESQVKIDLDLMDSSFLRMEDV